jgi:chromosome segregation ATPase
MLKKSLLVVGGLALLLTLFFGRAHLATICGRVSEQIDSAQSIDYKLDVARQELKDFDPAIRQAMHTIAKQEVEVELLTRQLAASEQAVATSESEVLARQNQVKNADRFVTIGDDTYTREELEADLRGRFEDHKELVNKADTERKTLEIQKAQLTAARKRFKEMVNAKREAELKLEALVARYKMVQVAETASEFNFDNSVVGRANERLHGLEKAIATKEKVVNFEGKNAIRIPIEAPKQTNLDEEITSYFNGHAKSVVTK